MKIQSDPSSIQRAVIIILRRRSIKTIFEDKDADEIFEMLRNRMEIVDFADYLRRYLFLQGELDLPFEEITDEMYKNMILKALPEMSRQQKQLDQDMESLSFTKSMQVKCIMMGMYFICL